LQGRRLAWRCYCFAFTVDGAIFNFASAEAAGKDRHIVVMNAAARQSLKTIARHKENIARPKRARIAFGNPHPSDFSMTEH
jgi:hypothetical protein